MGSNPSTTPTLNPTTTGRGRGRDLPFLTHHASHGALWVGLQGVREVLQQPTNSDGDGGPGPVQRRHTHLCSRYAGGDGGGIGSVSSPTYQDVPEGRFATLLLLQLRFTCRVAGDGDLPPIWEAVAWGKVRTEGLAILNQMLIRRLTSFCQIFGGRARFSPPPPPCVHK